MKHSFEDPSDTRGFYDPLLTNEDPCSELRPVNKPYEVWECGPGRICQVLQKCEPEEEATNLLATWVVAMCTPDEVSIETEAIADSIKNGCSLVWREGDGELPAIYRIEEADV